MAWLDRCAIRWERGPRSGRAALALAALLAGAALLGSSPARADDEFGHGFKDELGRIAAQQAFLVSRSVLAEIFRPLERARYVEPPPRRREAPGWRDHGEGSDWRWRREREPARYGRPRHPEHAWRAHRDHAAEDCPDRGHDHELAYRLERWERSGPGYRERYQRESRRW